MNNFGFNNYNNQSNPLAEILKNYMPSQSEAQSVQSINTEPQRQSAGAFNVYEIKAKLDIDYIEVEKSGQMQVFICPNEKRIYTRRYNHSNERPDYQVFIEEEESNLFKTQENNNEELGKIAQALVAVVNKLEAMDNAIHEIKNTKTKVIEKIIEKPIEVPVIAEGLKKEKLNRRPNGQFKKKGED